MNIDKNFWYKKKILITGHTGFKGGWLTVILNSFGSTLFGYSLNPKEKNNFFNLTNIKKLFKKDYRNDIINLIDLKKCIRQSKPEIIFHLAAQPSVIDSFKDSNKTILTNIVGTTNILEAVKNQSSVKCLIIITTDKVYKIIKTKNFFEENDELGGDDIYSGSKACCEIITNSYNKSFFLKKNCNIATVRAGNCIGGGDWTKDRIVKDALNSFFKNRPLKLRSPDSVRPWQHVLEPLTGYISLAEKLCSKKGKEYTGAWNFGPDKKQNMKVIDLAKLLKKTIHSESKIIIRTKEKKFYNNKFKVFESKYLSINNNKAKKKLKWKPKLSITEAIKLTTDWHKAFLLKKNLLKITTKQINNYMLKIK